jgi:hypothetical protein
MFVGGQTKVHSRVVAGCLSKNMPAWLRGGFYRFGHDILFC